MGAHPFKVRDRIEVHHTAPEWEPPLRRWATILQAETTLDITWKYWLRFDKDQDGTEAFGCIEYDSLEHEWCNDIQVRRLALLELIADAARDV